MDNERSRRIELGDFLRTRRAAMSPAQAGLPESGMIRRVPGLRREEVALLAAISTDYYTRLEQGRIAPSEPVMESLAQALQLVQEERKYLAELAVEQKQKRHSPHRRRRQSLHPTLRRILDDLSTTPAIVLGRRMEILAWNRAASTLLVDFDALGESERNYVRLVFTDEKIRALYDEHWSDLARTCVAMLRREAALAGPDQQMQTLIGELSIQDVDFRRWWADHHIAERRRGTKRLVHPQVGELHLDWDALTCAADPEQQMITWTAAEGTESAAKLSRLAHPGTEAASID